MNRDMISAYQAKHAVPDAELLDMLTESCAAVLDSVNNLRNTCTEVEAIKNIQESLVIMCAAIQVLAPDMMNIDYSSASTKLISAWKMLKGN